VAFESKDLSKGMAGVTFVVNQENHGTVLYLEVVARQVFSSKNRSLSDGDHNFVWGQRLQNLKRAVESQAN
jgi:hypothetical protein